MFRVLLASLLCLVVLAGCGESRHPVRHETIAPPSESVGSANAGQTGSGEAALPPGHPPMSAMQGGMPAMPPAGGGIKIATPEGWNVVQPKSSMIQAEFALPKAEGDEDDGRLTVMMAGGSIEANVQRWRDQFEELVDRPVEEIDVSGTKATLVDLSGTYNDQRGMMGPTTKRPGYRMLAAIIETPKGMLFVKGYGPANTMAKHADDFRAFVESLAAPADKE
jgi:hypothetical protein